MLQTAEWMMYSAVRMMRAAVGMSRGTGGALQIGIVAM